jgi:hypothetical protein
MGFPFVEYDELVKGCEIAYDQYAKMRLGGTSVGQGFRIQHGREKEIR